MEDRVKDLETDVSGLKLDMAVVKEQNRVAEPLHTKLDGAVDELKADMSDVKVGQATIDGKLDRLLEHSDLPTNGKRRLRDHVKANAIPVLSGSTVAGFILFFLDQYGKLG